MTKTSAVIATLNQGNVNCWPHASPALAAKAANTMNTDKSPREYHTFSANTRPRCWPACSMNESIFRLMTGKTHGIKLRISPPKKAEASCTANIRRSSGVYVRPPVCPAVWLAVSLGSATPGPSAAANGIRVGGRHELASHACTWTFPSIFTFDGSTPAANSIGAYHVTAPWWVSTVRLSKAGSFFESGEPTARICPQRGRLATV